MKNKNLPSLSIGIPAYNEEGNIAFLIENLLKQKFDNLTLKKIIIVSDGSTDKTVSSVRNIKNKKVYIIERKDRKGAMLRQNEILRMAKADILVMLDADILPLNNSFISEIVYPILQDEKIGIVGADTKSIGGKNFFERVIVFSHEFKKSIYMSIRKGNNLYMCHGRARAFSKKFYKTFTWVQESPEDAYSYLACISKGFKFYFTNNATIIFRSPTKLHDHSKQSIRFEKGKKNLLKTFSNALLDKEYKIPLVIFIRQLSLYLLKNPIYMLTYLCIKVYLLCFKSYSKMNFSMWDIAQSSKNLINI